MSSRREQLNFVLFIMCSKIYKHLILLVIILLNYRGTKYWLDCWIRCHSGSDHNYCSHSETNHYFSSLHLQDLLAEFQGMY